MHDLTQVYLLFYGPFPAAFFIIFVFSKQLTVNIQYIFCQWLDSNRRPLELEETDLPTEPQPLPLAGVLVTWKGQVILQNDVLTTLNAK